MKDTAHRKLFVGPMSVSIVDAVKDSDIAQKVGLIPSRRQIEYSGGYVNNWTTYEFLKYSQGTVRCRDHGGPLQGEDIDDGRESLKNDLSPTEHFEIIHIDTWKKEKDICASANLTGELIKYCSSYNPKVLFEIGTEQGIRPYSIGELEEFLTIIEKKIGPLFERVLYCVIQGGTGLSGTSNTGSFDPDKCASMISLCHNRGLLSKEHNGDYLSDYEISRRFELGLDSINIAPELGVNESSVFLDRLDSHQFDEVFEICYKSKKWKKWFPTEYSPVSDVDRLKLTMASCHYSFSHLKIKKLMKDVGISPELLVDMHKQFLVSKLNSMGSYNGKV